MDNKKILVIVPAYNESESIDFVIKNIKKFFSFADIAVINDCSSDNTPEKVLQFNDVILINLINNLGIGGAVQTGFKYALKHNYDIAVQVDGDGQHNPKFLSKLINTLISRNLDFVIGSRFLNGKGFQSSFLRRIGINILAKTIRMVTKKKVTDPTSGFRAYNKNIIQYLAENYPDDYPEPESAAELILKGYTFEEIPVIMNERFGGISSINFFDSIYYMVKVNIAILIKFIKYKLRIY